MYRRLTSTLFALVGCLGASEPVNGQEDLPLLRLIKPQPDESKWARVPWRTQLAEARREAVRTDKPLFVWRAGGGDVLGRA
jgi:hypothetical protein